VHPPVGELPLPRLVRPPADPLLGGFDADVEAGHGVAVFLRVRPVQVAPGDIDDVQPQLLGDELLGDGHGVPAEGAELAAEVHLAAVGRHGLHRLPDVLAPGRVPGAVAHVRRGAERRAPPAAVVGDGVQVHGGDQAVVLEADLDVEEYLVDVEVVHVGAVVDAAHRAARALGQQRRHELAQAHPPVAVFPALVDGRLVHLVQRRLVEDRQLVRPLRGPFDMQVLALAPVLVVIPVGHAAGRVRQVRRFRRQHEIEFEDLVGLLEARLRVAVDLVGDPHVAFRARPQVADDRRAGLGPLARIDDVRLHVPLDVQQGERFVADVLAFRDHDGGHFRPVLVGDVVEEGAEPRREDALFQLERLHVRVVPGDDIDHPRQRLGLRGVQALDHGVGVRAAQEFGEQHVRGDGVGAEAGLPRGEVVG